MKKLPTTIILLVLCALSAHAAGSQEAYYPTSQVLENEQLQITDEDIAKAFDADPQLVLPLRVAWYNMGTDSIVDQIQISSVPVSQRYEIPKTLIEGFLASGPSSYVRRTGPVTLNLDALRLAAARAKCDLLVVVGLTSIVQKSPNLLAIFNVLLLPALFNPAFDIRVECTAEMYVIDVRNEYLYGQVDYRPDPVVRRFLTIFQRDKQAGELRAEMLSGAAPHLSEQLDELFARYAAQPASTE